MSASQGSVKLLHAALDEVKDSSPGGKKGEIILRGVIDPASLGLLQVADYQREVLSPSKIEDLIEGFKSGSIPDVDLGMRGEKFTTREDAYYLQDPVFIVDGLQRVTAAMQFVRMATGKLPHLGATVHFNTTEKWERDRFKILNLLRTGLSPNVHLRNLRKDYPVVEMLYNLTQQEKLFALYQKICWSQRMRCQELVTATMLAKMTGRLHSRFAAGGLNNTNDTLSPALQKMMDKVGRNTMRDNVITFFDTLDFCWKVRQATSKEGTPHLRGTFMLTLAQIFAHHQAFWRDNRLFLDKPLREKLALLKVYDPQIINLASSGGKSGEVLYQIILNHINSGKRSKRLTPFPGFGPTGSDSAEEEQDPPETNGVEAASGSTE